MKKWQKCECGQEYEAFRGQCSACGRPCDGAVKQVGWSYHVLAYVADDELEEKLNDREAAGWKIYRWDRNKENRAGVENSTITFRKRRYE
jgi:hypothetical protein